MPRPLSFAQNLVALIRVIILPTGQFVRHLTLTLKIIDAEKSCYTKLRHVKHVSCPSTNSHEGLFCFIKETRESVSWKNISVVSHVFNLLA